MYEDDDIKLLPQLGIKGAPMTALMFNGRQWLNWTHLDNTSFVLYDQMTEASLNALACDNRSNMSVLPEEVNPLFVPCSTCIVLSCPMTQDTSGYNFVKRESKRIASWTSGYNFVRQNRREWLVESCHVGPVLNKDQVIRWTSTSHQRCKILKMHFQFNICQKSEWSYVCTDLESR